MSNGSVKQYYRCWAEVDLSALRENLAWLRHRLGPKVKIMTVVKADAYGHGLKQIAALLMQSGTDIFGVANLAEAQAIRSVGRGWPVLMLGACLPGEMEQAVRDNVALTLSSSEEADQLAATAKRLGCRVDVHLKVNTGMGRLGVQPEEIDPLVRRITELENLQFQGLYTHYSSAESDAGFSRGQREQFCALVEKLRSSGLQIPLVHANNSAAVLCEPETYFDLARPGLLVYGISPGNERGSVDFEKSIRPALSFHCRVGLVKEMPADSPISYGHTFVTPQKMRIATLTAGYGDGYSRAGSNRAEVLIRGRRCRVLGRITMDQMMVDASALDTITVGEVATLIGRQGEDEITAGQVAEWCHTIPWEVLTSITYRVPRIYRGSHAA